MSELVSAEVLAALEDVAITHITHQPESEFSSAEQLCWSFQKAHWFYLDEFCSNNPVLPAYSFPEFLRLIVAVVPGLESLQSNVPKVVAAFNALKFSIPVYGAILLTAALDKVLLVRDTGPRAAWTFPKGKLEKQDQGNVFACAQREVLEETGYDISRNGVDAPSHFLERDCHGKQVGLFIVPGVEESFPFAPRCKGEISEYAWFLVSDLPRNRDVEKTHVRDDDDSKLRYYHVHNFISGLSAWIDRQLGRKPKKGDAKRAEPAHARVPTWAEGDDTDGPLDFERFRKRALQLQKRDATREYDGVRPAYQRAALRGQDQQVSDNGASSSAGVGFPQDATDGAAPEITRRKKAASKAGRAGKGAAVENVENVSEAESGPSGVRDEAAARAEAAPAPNRLKAGTKGVATPNGRMQGLPPAAAVSKSKAKGGRERQARRAAVPAAGVDGAVGVLLRPPGESSGRERAVFARLRPKEPPEGWGRSAPGAPGALLNFGLDLTRVNAILASTLT